MTRHAPAGTDPRTWPGGRAPRPQRSVGSRVAAYAVTTGIVLVLFLGAVAFAFVSAGGFDDAAYDCTSLFCKPTDAALLTTFVGAPIALGVAVVAWIGVLVLQLTVRTWHWAAESAIAVAVALVLAAVVVPVVVGLD